MLVWRGHRAKVRSLAFSPDGRHIATTAGTSQYVWLWEASTGKRVRKLAGNSDSARMVAFIPDGKHIVATAYHGGGWIAEVETGTVVARFWSQNHDPDTLAISPDGERLIASDSVTLSVWDQLMN